MKSWLRYGLVCVLLFGGVTFAASLSDFKDAVDREGCESIPYGDLRDTCKSKASDRDDYCKGGHGPFACDDLDPAGLTKQIENVKQKIEDLEHQRDDLKDKRSDAKDDDERREIDDKIEEIEKKIDELQKKVDEWEHRLSEEKHAIEDRIDIGKRCLDARNAVADVFANAKRQAQSESDPDIKPYAEKLVSKWEAGEETHAQAIELVKAAIDKCERMK